MGSVFGTLADLFLAEAVVRELKQAGFSKQAISMLFAKKGKLKAWIREKHSKTLKGTGMGGLLGTAVGWLLGLLSWVLAPQSPLFPGSSMGAENPLQSAWPGGLMGLAIGGVVGALIGLFIPEYKVKKLETKLKEGDVFVSVQTQNEEEVERAKEIFQNAEAENIAETLGMAA